jgi:UDP-N-acetylmuramoyl-L-alanyl-D-glutamate--2,6-diaminopimelate ligase
MMKLLKDIIYGVRIEDIIGSTNCAIEHIAYDSRKVNKFTLFVATKGTLSDGHDYIDKAIELGANAIICEQMPSTIDSKATYVLVKDSSKALGIVAANFYDHPSEKLKLVGVTGTNGKTTSVTLLYDLFKLFGFKVGLLSTVVNKIHNEVVVSTHTTPNALDLNHLLHRMVAKGCEYCFMEVSSHAVHQNRIHGVTFAGGVFTNITHDHLDYHKTFDNYILAKKGFFDQLPEGSFALTNADQTHGSVMVQNTKAKVFTYGIKTMADFKTKIIENRFDGLHLEMDKKELFLKLIGDFNAYNATVAYGVAVLLGKDKLEVLAALSNLSAPQGRFQQFVSETGITAIVDYAHTPDALENVLETIKSFRTGNEMVITIVGCGGNRDKEKRPKMAAIATRLSDKVILTSDNPRNENPETIIEEMRVGVPPQDFKKTLAITNRKEAIMTACSLAHKGDIVLIAGKGHETYQEINGETFPFDDYEIVTETFKNLEK